MALAGREIVVIGAGIGGLAAALALAQRRARVTVHEVAPALGEAGAGLQIGPNGVAVLEALGLRDAVERVASLPEAIELRDHRDGRRVARLPLGATATGRYGRPYWHLHRADLAAALAEAARAAGVRIVLGSRIVEVELDGAAPQLRTAEGAQIEAETVIAADGVRSDTRSSCFRGAPARFTGHVAWRALVPTDRLPAGLVAPQATVTMGPGRHIVTYPLRAGRLVNVVAIEERAGWTEEGWSLPDDPAALRRAFAGWGGGTATLLEAVDEVFLWGLFDHARLPAWARGRLALLGDACHPMLPYLAQGATMALEDAWVLAAELDVAESPERGLMAYEARRVPRATRVQRASLRNARIYHMQGSGPRAIAHTVLRAADRLAPDLLLRRFDWLYGTDVVGAHAAG